MLVSTHTKGLKMETKITNKIMSEGTLLRSIVVLLVYFFLFSLVSRYNLARRLEGERYYCKSSHELILRGAPCCCQNYLNDVGNISIVYVVWKFLGTDSTR